MANDDVLRMMMFPDFLAAVVASHALLNLWFDSRSFLFERRAVAQNWRWGLARKLSQCRFCLSFWFGMACVSVPVLLTAIAREDLYELGWFLRFVLYGLAAVGLLHLLEPKDHDHGIDDEPESDTIPFEVRPRENLPGDGDGDGPVEHAGDD